MVKKISIPQVEVPMDTYFLAESGIYKETQAKAKERFGENSQAYNTIMYRINPNKGEGSQFFFNTELGLHLPKGQRVISLGDLERIYSFSQAASLFDGSFYTDMPEVILRTETPSRERNKNILSNLVKQVKAEGYEFSSENPLRISGLELAKDDGEKKYGFLLNIGENTRIVNDGRFVHSNNKIQLGNQSKTLYTKENGLSGLYLDRSLNLNSDDDNLANSYDDGQVVLTDAEVVAKK